MLVISMKKVSGWVEARIQVSWVLHWGYFYRTKPQTFHPSPGCNPLLCYVLGKKKPLAVTLRMLWFDLTLVYQVTNSIHCSQDYIWRVSEISYWTELKICLNSAQVLWWFMSCLISWSALAFMSLGFCIGKIRINRYNPTCASVVWVAICERAL